MLATLEHGARSGDFTPSQLAKMAVFAHGVGLDAGAREIISGGDSNALLTTGDYGTTDGIIFELGTEVVNAPYAGAHPFAQDSPYELRGQDGVLYIAVKANGDMTRVRHIAPPAYLRDPEQPKWLSKVIATHTDRARLTPITGCGLGCHFCDVPFDQEKRYGTNPIDQMVEAVQIAIDDPVRPARHLLISGGTPRSHQPEDFDYLNLVYETIADKYRKKFPITIMMSPSIDNRGRPLLVPARLKEIGIHALSINIELADYTRLARSIMKGKAEIGEDRYFSTLESAVAVFGVRRVRSMLIVGLEPPKQTLAMIEELAKRGISVEGSPFRPVAGTPLAGTRPPSVEVQKRVYSGQQAIIAKYEPDWPGLNDGEPCDDCKHNTGQFSDQHSLV